MTYGGGQFDNDSPWGIRVWVTPARPATPEELERLERLEERDPALDATMAEIKAQRVRGRRSWGAT